jgi:hypothetical protein
MRHGVLSSTRLKLLDATALEILPLVSPLLGSSDPTVRQNADLLLHFLGANGNAKELFLSGSERLQRLVSDNAADLEGEPEDEGDMLQEIVGLVKLFSERASMLHTAGAINLTLIVTVTPRVKSRRPSAFFSSTTSTILDTLDTLDLSSPTSRPLLDAICTFLDSFNVSGHDPDEKVLRCTIRIFATGT